MECMKTVYRAREIPSPGLILRGLQGFSVRNCGTIIFMTISDPEQLLRARLSALPLAEVRYRAVTGSTNNDALQWLEAGAADESLVVADQQTAGRGRLQRRWITEPGAALAFSLILRPTPAETAHLALFSPLAGLAVADGLATCCGLSAAIKWPNDVLLNGKKACGILAETTWHGDRIAGIVLGIGVNVAPTAVPPAATLMFPAISVEEVLSCPVDRWDLLAAILRSVFTWRPKLGSREFFQSWEDRLAFKGELVQIQAPGGKLEGQLVGIDPHGNLLLRTDAGKMEVITAGDVSLRPAGNS